MAIFPNRRLRRINLRQAEIIILEILPCIPVVIISFFLDLGKNILFSDSLPGYRAYPSGVNQSRVLLPGRRPYRPEAGPGFLLQHLSFRRPASPNLGYQFCCNFLNPRPSVEIDDFGASTLFR